MCRAIAEGGRRCACGATRVGLSARLRQSVFAQKKSNAKRRARQARVKALATADLSLFEGAARVGTEETQRLATHTWIGRVADMWAEGISQIGQLYAATVARIEALHSERAASAINEAERAQAGDDRDEQMRCAQRIADLDRQILTTEQQLVLARQIADREDLVAEHEAAIAMLADQDADLDSLGDDWLDDQLAEPIRARERAQAEYDAARARHDQLLATRTDALPAVETAEVELAAPERALAVARPVEHLMAIPAAVEVDRDGNVISSSEVAQTIVDGTSVREAEERVRQAQAAVDRAADAVGAIDDEIDVARVWMDHAGAEIERLSRPADEAELRAARKRRMREAREARDERVAHLAARLSTQPMASPRARLPLAERAHAQASVEVARAAEHLKAIEDEQTFRIASDMLSEARLAYYQAADDPKLCRARERLAGHEERVAELRTRLKEQRDQARALRATREPLAMRRKTKATRAAQTTATQLATAREERMKSLAAYERVARRSERRHERHPDAVESTAAAVTRLRDARLFGLASPEYRTAFAEHQAAQAALEDASRELAAIEFLVDLAGAERRLDALRARREALAALLTAKAVEVA